MQYKKFRDVIVVENGVLLMGTRPVIPLLLRKSVIAAAHREHFGMNTTKSHLRRNAWWPGLDRDVEKYVANCAECSKKTKTNVVSQSFRWELEELPFRRVHMNWAFVPRVGEVLITVDSFSGWPEAFVCKDRSSATVLKALKSVFARFGVPRMLVTDHAKEFISEEIVAWLRQVGCEKI